MPITIGSNIASLGAQRQLGKSSESLNSIYETLSSGMRINKASDDAAGLAVSVSLKTDARVFTQGVRNINDGISGLSISEGALTQLASLTTRQIELSEQAANGSYSLAQRKAMDTEANALVKEFNRIVSSTSFNGIKLLDGSLISGLQLQAGYGSQNTLQYGVGGSLARTVGDGTFNTAVSYKTSNATRSIFSADVNGDGKVDMILSSQGNVDVLIGNGDGSFLVKRSYTTTTPTAGNNGSAVYQDVNGDGVNDFVTTQGGAVAVLFGNNDGSFKAAVTYTESVWFTTVASADLNGDGVNDLVLSDNSGTNAIGVMLGNANGTFNALNTSYITGPTPRGISLADINGDGKVDAVVADASGSRVNIFLGNGDGTFQVATSITTAGANPVDVKILDLNHDGILDMVVGEGGGFTGLQVFLGNGDGTFYGQKTFAAAISGASLQIADMNGDGYADVLSQSGVWLGNGDGTFKAIFSFSGLTNNPTSVGVGDFNGDGAIDVAVGTINSPGPLYVALANPTQVTSVGQLNLLSQSDARASLETTKATLDRINAELGNIGSFESRLSIASNNLQTLSINYSASASRITDVDVAEASSSLIQTKILQQAGASILSQANQEPQIALTLLRGLN